MDPTQLAYNVFNQFADQYAIKFMDVSLYHNGLNKWCELFSPQNGTILELACGPGNITKYIINKLPYANITATDIAPNMLEIAATIHPNIKTQLLDLRELKALLMTYNGIICAFGLPYLTKNDVHQLLKDMHSMLKEGGLIYISTMEGEYSTSRLHTTPAGNLLFMHYYEFEFLNDALMQFGFNVLHSEKICYQDSSGSNVVDLIFVAQKQ